MKDNSFITVNTLLQKRNTEYTKKILSLPYIKQTTKFTFHKILQRDVTDIATERSIYTTGIGNSENRNLAVIAEMEGDFNYDQGLIRIREIHLNLFQRARRYKPFEIPREINNNPEYIDLIVKATLRALASPLLEGY